MDNSISFPPSFLTLDSSFHILGAPIKSISFVKSFVVEALHEDFGMISILPMFVIFSLCYVQRSGYLLRTMFPSPSILQHYVEFSIRTIVMLEKLLGVGSFSNFISHQICHHATLLASSGEFNLFLWFELLPLHSWGVGHSSLLHLSFIFNRMIVLFFWMY